jgi:hypothetical protein
MIRHRTPFAVVVLVAATFLGGCGGNEAVTPTATSGTGNAGATMLPNSGMTIAEARGGGEGDAVVVRAYVVISPDGTARLCDETRESFPPQCGQTAIVVTDLPPELMDGLESANGVRWSDGQVQLIATIRDGIFVNDPVALAAS